MVFFPLNQGYDFRLQTTQCLFLRSDVVQMCRLTKLAHANLVPTSSRKPMDVDGTTPVNSAAASVFAKGQDDPRDNDHPKPSETVLGIGMRPPPRPFVPSRGDQETQKTKDTSPADLPRDAFLEVSSACEMNCFRLKGLEGHLLSKESIPKSGSKQKCLG
jgi:hypothetical protein